MEAIPWYGATALLQGQEAGCVALDAVVPRRNHFRLPRGRACGLGGGGGLGLKHGFQTPRGQAQCGGGRTELLQEGSAGGMTHARKFVTSWA